jgi:hypothetical protein
VTEINRQPQGLSDFLLVRAGGLNPDDLSQSVRPTIDIEPYYQPDRLRAASVNFNNAGTLDFIAVPEGEIWKVLGFGVEIDPATSTQGFMLSIWHERIPGQGLNGVPWMSVQSNMAMEQTVVARWVWAREVRHPRVLTPEQRVVMSYDSGDRSSIQGTFYVTYVLLQD